MDSNSKSFNIKSNQYAQSRPKYPSDFYEYLITLVNHQDILWDCACGNGQVSIDLVDVFEKIFATDINENQIKNAFKHPRINYSVTPSEKTSFSNNYFDLICVAQALHWFDLDAFFKEVDRVLKPNGILAIFGYGFVKINNEVDKIINEVLHSEIDKYWSDGNRLIISGFKGINFPFKKIDTPYFNMNQKWKLSDLISYLDTWSAVKRYNEKNNSDIVEMLRIHLEPFWKSNDYKTAKMDLYSYIRRK